MFLAAAPFIPAVDVLFLMLLLGGYIGYKDFLQSSSVLLLINTFAVIGAHSIDTPTTNTLLSVLILFPISYCGVLIVRIKVLNIFV